MGFIKCNCCRTKESDAKIQNSEIKKDIKDKKKKKSKKKHYDVLQEPVPRKNGSNVPNPYNEKEAKRLFLEEEKRMMTGDILLFDIKGILRYVERIITKTKFDHVGIIVEEKDIPDDIFKKFDLVKSRNKRVFVLHIIEEGMRIDYIRDFLNVKGTRLCYRHLITERTDRLLNGLQSFMREHCNTPYEKNTIEMFRSAYDGKWGVNKQDDLSSLFCSEMVAKTYQDMGLLFPADSGGLVCNEYAPRDFTSMIELNLLCDATLEDEIMLYDEDEFK